MGEVLLSEKATASLKQIERAMRALFELVRDRIADAQKRGDASYLRNGHRASRSNWTMEVLEEFLIKDVKDRWLLESPDQLAIDYIAGMTDSFFRGAFSELFLPKDVG